MVWIGAWSVALIVPAVCPVCTGTGSSRSNMVGAIDSKVGGQGIGEFAHDCGGGIVELSDRSMRVSGGTDELREH